MSVGRLQGRRSRETPSHETAFDILSCQRRRYVLHYLLSEEARTELGILARQLAAWENEIDREAVTSKQRVRTYTALRQSHLPKMDDAGFVEFDRDRGTVELTDDGAELRVYLQVVPGDEIPWSRFYLGLSLLGVGVIGAVAWGVVPFAALSPIGWMGLFVGLFGSAACYHEFATRRTRLGSGGRPPT
jgi:hypothetical protein